MKTNLKNLGLGLGISLLASTSWSQDVHFAQFEYSPMTLNPGLVGANERMQANVNYRTQWSSVAVPYTTIGASVEARFNENKRQKKGIIAGGLNFFNDKVGNLPLSTTKVNINVAYHLILNRQSTIGLGLYTGFGQRSLDPTDGKWGNQYNGAQYDATISSNEVFTANEFSFFDAGTGLVYKYKSGNGRTGQDDQKMFTGGIAFYHLNAPNYSFINNEDEKLPMRMSLFANALLTLNNSNGALVPGVYFNKQKSNWELQYGTYYQFTLGSSQKPNHLGIGAFHRWGDAFILKTYVEVAEFTGGFAYDFNLSSLSEVSRGRGGIEFFLVYKMGSKGFSRSQI